MKVLKVLKRLKKGNVYPLLLWGEGLFAADLKWASSKSMEINTFLANGCGSEQLLGIDPAIGKIASLCQFEELDW